MRNSYIAILKKVLDTGKVQLPNLPEKAVWRSVFLTIQHCILYADSTKTHSSGVTFLVFLLTGYPGCRRNTTFNRLGIFCVISTFKIKTFFYFVSLGTHSLDIMRRLFPWRYENEGRTPSYAVQLDQKTGPRTEVK